MTAVAGASSAAAPGAPALSTFARRLWQASIVAAALLVWSLSAQSSPNVRDVLGDPALVADQIAQWVKSGEIVKHVGITTAEAAIGFVIGAVLGAVTAFSLTFVPILRRTLDPLIGIAAVVPRIVLAPIFMVWFGLGISSKAALVATIVFFIIYFNVESGLRNIPPVLVDRMRTFGAGRLGLLRELYVPSCLVWILSGLRISVGFAFVGAIVSEYLGANSGIGALIASGQSLNDPNLVMAGLVVVLVVVTPIDRLLARIEARAAAWRT